MAPPDVLSSQGRRQITAHAGDAVLKQRHDIRRELLQRRRALSPTEQQSAGHALLAQLQHWRPFQKARRVASYIAVGAELPTQILNDCILTQGKSLYLPSLQSAVLATMRFRHIQANSAWVLNRFGIPEPSHSCPAINPAFLDIVFVPLVGFDAQGNRMGMGAGYYDRALAFRRHRQHWRRPRLVGLGFACQQVEALPAAPWDVPLDAIVTENAIISP